MIPVQFPEANGILAAGQDEYEPLPIHRASGDRRGVITCCFRLSPVELEEIARTRTLWFQVLTFGQALQPIALSTQQPELPRGT